MNYFVYIFLILIDRAYVHLKILHRPSIYLCFHPQSFVHWGLRHRLKIAWLWGNVFSKLHTKALGYMLRLHAHA